MSPAPRASIVIADGHPAFREGLRRLLESIAIFSVVGARALILKDAGLDVLHRAVKAVLTDRYWIGRRSVRDRAAALGEFGAFGAGSPPPFGITSRELAVLRDGRRDPRRAGSVCGASRCGRGRRASAADPGRLIVIGSPALLS